MTKYREFAARLNYIMVLKGLRNRDIVEAYKNRGQVISSSAVSQLLSGRFAPTRERVELLAEILGVEEKWLQGHGSVEDVYRPDNKELTKMLRRIRKIFLSLRPELQRMVMQFMEYTNQADTFIFQQQMSEMKKVKKELIDVVNPIISVSGHKDK